MWCKIVNRSWNSLDCRNSGSLVLLLACVLAGFPARADEKRPQTPPTTRTLTPVQALPDTVRSVGKSNVAHQTDSTKPREGAKPASPSPPAPRLSPKVAEFLTKWGEVYLHARTMQFTDVINYTNEPSGRSAKRVRIRFWARRPNLMRVEVETDDPKEGALMVSDGRDVWEYSTSSNQYLKQPVPEGPLLIHGKIGALPYMPYSLIFHPDPVEALKQGLLSASIESSEDVDGEPCVIIARHFAASLHIVWCSTRDYMPRRAINFTLQDGLATQVYREERRDIKVDSPISDEQFRFSPPRDARIYTEFVPTEALLKTGTTLPEMFPSDVTGSTVRLSSLLGHPTVLFFWASWSSPCESELDVLQSLAKSASGTRATVLALNIWDRGNPLRRYSQRYPAVTFLHDGEQNQSNSVAYRRYGVRGVPTTYLIDAHSKVVRAWIGYDTHMVDELRAALKELLHP